MRISNIQNNNYNNKYNRPSFGIWTRGVYNSSKKGLVEPIYRNDTMFFRDPVFWERFTNLLGQKFNEQSNVNVYCYGCSDGSEPYTFAMNVLAKGKDFAQKFLPVQARDIDSIAICRALDSEYELTHDEIFRIENVLDDKYELINDKLITTKNTQNHSLRKYFDYHEYKREYLSYGDKLNVKVKEPLKNSVQFSMGDIFEDYKNINPENTVVLARNFWPYIDDISKRSKFFKDLYDHLKEGSLFVIGNFDTKEFPMRINSVKEEVQKAGFKETEVENVFEKR